MNRRGFLTGNTKFRAGSATMGGEVSKLAVAKKFAKRRALYRKKSAQAYERAMADDDIRNSFWERAERFQMAAEAIEYMWHDVRGDL